MDGGDDGWLDFDEEASSAVEAAHAQFSSQEHGIEAVDFTGYGGNRYSVDFNFLVQRNLATGYVRPVRRVPK